MTKNRSAVHLGNLSAASREKKAGGKKAFKNAMKELRKLGLQKKKVVVQSEVAAEASK